MQAAVYVAMSRQEALERAMEVVSNNLANASTSGFKGRQMLFQDYLQPGPNGQQIAYVREAGTTRDLRQGDLKMTGNTLDMALEGGGYYSVSTGAGPRYTRNGSFQTTPSGQLVTAQGDQVIDNSGNPIALPTTQGPVLIGQDGTISKNGIRVAKLGVVSFDTPQTLVEEQQGLYTTDATPNPDTTTTVHQGAIEMSNIQSVVEITRMMGIQGAYGDTIQVMNSEDTRMKNAIDKLSRVA
jgi:flagellar basal-body rod protein FlgF